MTFLITRMSSLVLIVMVASLISKPSPLQAEDDPPGDRANKALTEIGRIASSKINSSRCEIGIAIDFESFQERLPIFREAWLNRDYSLDFYKQRRKQTFVFVIAKRLGELVTEGVYQDKTKPECSFTITADYRDKMGQPKKIEVSKWAFSKELYGRIDWEHFDPRNFQDVAAHYELGANVRDWISEEPSMAADEPTTKAAPTCDMFLFRANAMFIRATTFCKEDFMDSKAGLKALEGARECAKLQDEEGKVKAAMLILDDLVHKSGKKHACLFLSDIAQRVLAR